MIDLLMADHATLTEDAKLFDGLRLRAERLERAQAGLRERILAALLFDPNNTRYAVSIGVAAAHARRRRDHLRRRELQMLPINVLIGAPALFIAIERFGPQSL
jgi:hypothetical protein